MSFPDFNSRSAEVCALLADIPDAVLVADEGSGLLIAVNPAALELFGCPAGELIGQHLSGIYPARVLDAVLCEFRKLSTVTKGSLMETWIRRRDGREVPVEIHWKRGADPGAWVWLVVRDISARKQAESRETAQLESRVRAAFLARMSHELRTPLNAVVGFSELLERNLAEERVEKCQAGNIARSARQLLQLVNEWLEWPADKAPKQPADGLPPAATDAPHPCPQPLPQEFIRLVEDAIPKGNMPLIRSLVEALPAELTTTADNLRQLCDAYDYESLKRILTSSK